jgi:hypothetical protein
MVRARRVIARARRSLSVIVGSPLGWHPAELRDPPRLPTLEAIRRIVMRATEPKTRKKRRKE